MINLLPHTAVLSIKKWSYWIFIPVALIPWLSMQLAEVTGQLNLFSWLGVFMVFVTLPVADLIVGKDVVNPTVDEERQMTDDPFYRFTAVMLVPVVYSLLVYGANVFNNILEFSLLGALGWVLSCGVIIAILSINAGHDLIHKDNRWESWAGGFLYAAISFGGFKVEHLRGHHVNVSTPKDASSARYGQSLYQFLSIVYVHNQLSAWVLEKERLAKRNLPLWHWKNELIWWYGVSVLLLIGLTMLFGISGFVFFLGVSWVSITTLEIVNYIEHYGLHRRQLDNGKYERTTPAHSWNSSYFLSNIGMFQVQRHSDHHAFPKRRYQVLRHYEESPQLPFGYATMYLIALVPPLWFRIMNPRVDAYYQGEKWQLSSEQFEASASGKILQSSS